ncbi:MAG: flagellin lysine-N-methylase, partial [Lachnospiraceae bacterium]|nr:flagellin lysine-N-methylase [Candidatus Equihabitans merdae]
MIVRFPDHYFDFECMGGPCPDNCCIGDELVIDEDTFLYYQSIEGEFGDHLRDVLKDAVCSEDETGVVYCMDVNGRCPFLREDNYCEIVLALGQEALGHVCATYPRSEDCLGCDVEMNLILSCPEAARQLLTKEAVTTFEEANVADEEFIPNEDYEEPEYLCYAEDEIKSIRSELISLMQDRSLSLAERIRDAAKVCLEKSVTGDRDGNTYVSSTCSSLLDPTYEGYLTRTALLADLPWQTELW